MSTTFPASRRTATRSRRGERAGGAGARGLRAPTPLLQLLQEVARVRGSAGCGASYHRRLAQSKQAGVRVREPAEDRGLHRRSAWPGGRRRRDRARGRARPAAARRARRRRARSRADVRYAVRRPGPPNASAVGRCTGTSTTRSTPPSGVVADEPPAVPLHAPDAALGVDRQAVGGAVRRRARTCGAARWSPRRRVVVVGRDGAGAGVREVQRAPVGAPVEAVRLDDVRRPGASSRRRDRSGTGCRAGAARPRRPCRTRSGPPGRPSRR